MSGYFFWADIEISDVGPGELKEQSNYRYRISNYGLCNLSVVGLNEKTVGCPALVGRAQESESLANSII